MTGDKIRILKQGNVQFVFENGITVSAYVGVGSYSSSKAATSHNVLEILRSPDGAYDSEDVELGIFVTDNAARTWVTARFIDTSGDDVAANVPIGVVFDIIARVRKLTREEVKRL